MAEVGAPVECKARARSGDSAQHDDVRTRHGRRQVRDAPHVDESGASWDEQGNVCQSAVERERERGREREREIERDKDRNRETERQRDREVQREFI